MINLELIKKIYSLHSSFKMPAYDKDCHSMREFCQNEDTASLVLEKNNAEEDLIDRINMSKQCAKSCQELRDSLSHNNYTEQQKEEFGLLNRRLLVMMAEIETLNRLICIVNDIIAERSICVTIGVNLEELD